MNKLSLAAVAIALLSASLHASAGLPDTAAAATLPLPTMADSPVDSLIEVSATRYFTTTPSTPAGAATTYNALHRPSYGGDLSGVAQLFLNVDSSGFGNLCSGALLADGVHILTAAHCVTNASGVMDVDLATTTNQARFGTTSTGANGLGSRSAPVSISAITVHPGWTGNYSRGGNDLAILTLATAAPIEAKRYDIYTSSDEIGKVTLKSGWGTFGDGATGVAGGTGWRMGQNTYDMNALTFWGASSGANTGILMYDFDNGLAANDAFGTWFGAPYQNLGLGDNEVISGPGDSGGPSFIDGKVAGITSFGITFFDARDPSTGAGICTSANPDKVCGLNGSFGEFAGDTRVSAYSSWITAQLAAPVPEPLSGAMLLAGLGVIGSVARRRRSV